MVGKESTLGKLTSTINSTEGRMGFLQPGTGFRQAAWVKSEGIIRSVEVPRARFRAQSWI